MDELKQVFNGEIKHYMTEVIQDTINGYLAKDGSKIEEGFSSADGITMDNLVIYCDEVKIELWDHPPFQKNPISIIQAYKTGIPTGQIHIENSDNAILVIDESESIIEHSENDFDSGLDYVIQIRRKARKEE